MILTINSNNEASVIVQAASAAANAQENDGKVLKLLFSCFVLVTVFYRVLCMDVQSLS